MSTPARRAPAKASPAAKKGPAPRAAAPAPAPPPRAATDPAPVPGSQASVNEFLAAYIMGVANRLANGASNHYRSRFNLGMSEWRAMMAVGAAAGGEMIVREVAENADLDYAAASKSVRALEERGYVRVEQTSRRGRAALVQFTPEGAELYLKLRASAQRRNRRLISNFTPEETRTLWALLRRVEQQVPYMNAE